MNTPHYLIAILAHLFPLLTTAIVENGAGHAPVVGSWKPIQNISDSHVTEIAKFAVTKHNSENNKNLVFQKVVKGEYQIVSGTLYRLVISVKGDISVLVPTAYYQVVVLEKRWANDKKLVAFQQLTN